MSRVTQLIDYINQDKEPPRREKRALYTSITTSIHLKTARRLYRKRLKKTKEKECIKKPE